MKNLKTIFLLALGTLILKLVGFYNGYPLVYSDTGTYLYSGFDKFIPVDRPVTYGLFVYFFSFRYSLWLVILFQNILTAYCIFEVLKVIKINARHFRFLYLGIVTFLTFFTGTGWYSNQIMPDFFTPICVLLIFILVLGNIHSGSKKIILGIILSFSLTTHFSNLVIGGLFMAVLLFCRYIFRNYLKEKQLLIPYKRMLVVTLIVLSGWLLLPCINFLVEKKFIVSKASHVFLMAHLDDTGILKKFLTEKCKTEKYRDCKLCQYKDSLPGELSQFLWSGKILEKTGGWTDSKEEYNRIINGTITDPKYLSMNIYKSLTYGMIQLTNNNIGQGLTAYTEGSAPYGQIQWRFRDELNNYMNSKQNMWNAANLKFTTINTFHLILLMVSFFIILYIFSTSFGRKSEPLTIILLVMILLSVIINAFATAGLNAPCERYQARIVWLVPFALILVGYMHFGMKKILTQS